MSVPELTVPVQLGDTTVRGMYDLNGSSILAGGIDVQITGPVLFLIKGSLPLVERESFVLIGELGAASAAGGERLLVHEIRPVQDGLLIACRVGGGR